MSIVVEMRDIGRCTRATELVLSLVAAMASLPGCTGNSAGGEADHSVSSGTGGAQGGSAGSGGGRLDSGSTGGTSSSGGSASGGTATGGNGAGGSGGTSEPTECPGDLTLCGDTCVDLDGSSAHCGACDEPCETGHLCASGTCSSECAPGYSRCGSKCVDLASDPTNCGGCGFFCNVNSPCLAGVCGCPDGALACQGRCIDPEVDRANCGSCGNACPAGAACVGGACTCPEGGALCDEACVSVDTRNDCGGCGEGCSTSEICASGACIDSTESCPDGTTLCGSGCVDTRTSAFHCGGCDQRCAPGQLCRDGSCACPSGFEWCGDACVDLDVSGLHCGACDAPCTAGQACDDGECQCTDPDEIACGSACINPDTDRSHCGTCDNACDNGSPCIEGVCSCPRGEVLCEPDCVDLESNADHCGACGEACPEGETCIVGVCSGPAGDACTDVLAHSLNITEIAVYQAGKVSVMQAGSAVPAAARAVDLVAGKDALFRISVRLEPGWEDRVVSARLTLENGDEVEQTFHKKTVSADSSDGTLSSTFNIQVMGSALTTSSAYSISIVECGATTGTPLDPRFPSQGSQELEVRHVGDLEVHFVPIVANGIPPDTSPARLEGFREYVEKLYPVSAVSYSLGMPLVANSTIGAEGEGWVEALQQLSNRHQSDDAPNDLYYYGLIEPAESFAQFCQAGCVGGIGYVTELGSEFRHLRVAMGLSYGQRINHETAGHELGHAHGRAHAPCGNPGDVDLAYPYADGSIGWWGLELPNRLYVGADASDMMGYCENQWISDYTYQAVLERSAAINSALSYRNPNPVGRFRVLVQSRSGATWGEPPSGEVEAVGRGELAIIVDQQGKPVAEVVVYRGTMGHLGGASIMVPEPEPGWHAIVVRGLPPVAYSGTSQSLP